MSDLDNLNQGPKWSAIHTYHGYENKVKTNLEKIIENRNLSDVIFDIRIPTQIVTVVNDKGESKEVEEKLLPAYVLIKMVMTDATWHVVRHITGVTGFVGPESRPTPLPDDELQRFSIECHVEEIAFKVGDRVAVVSGQFQGFEGTVTAISEDNKKVDLLVSAGIRQIPVLALDVSDVRAAE